MAATSIAKIPRRDVQEDIYIATQWTLMWRKFRKHKLAMAGTALVALFYLIAIFSEFIATQDPLKRNSDFIFVPPQGIHFVSPTNGLGVYIYGLKQTEDPDQLEADLCGRHESGSSAELLCYRRPLQHVGHHSPAAFTCLEYLLISSFSRWALTILGEMSSRA